MHVCVCVCVYEKYQNIKKINRECILFSSFKLGMHMDVCVCVCGYGKYQNRKINREGILKLRIHIRVCVYVMRLAAYDFSAFEYHA